MLGAGDGFMAGLLKGWLDGEAWERTLAYANACGAFAVSRHGCAPSYPTWAELDVFLKRGVVTPALRKDPELAHIHWATTRRGDWPALRVFAFDHRAQLEEIAAEVGAGAERIGRFKALCLDATRHVADGRAGYGILCDPRLGADALMAAAGSGLWIGRPVEKPGSRPLELEIGRDYGSALAEWPLEHVVKVLCFYHPDDAPETKAAQEEVVLRLAEAARANGLELLLEIVASKAGPLDDDTTARAMARFYDLGVKPDWWKLEPLRSDAAWARALRGDRGPRPVVPGHRGARARRGGGRPARELRPRRAARAGEGLRGRAHDLRRGRARLARGGDRGRGRDRRHGGALRAPLCDLGRSSGDDAMTTIRLTAAQAMVRWLAAQESAPGEAFFAGVWAIFGHGNVAGLGEALHGVRDRLPTFRGHNEQSMAHAAIAYAKASNRRRAMAVTSSIGPGATNMLTAAALAHVNRLPVLFLPGDVFASRAARTRFSSRWRTAATAPSAPTTAFARSQRYFDRITRPEQLLAALPRANGRG